jgi:hypothetical protein
MKLQPGFVEWVMGYLLGGPTSDRKTEGIRKFNCTTGGIRNIQSNK